MIKLKRGPAPDFWRRERVKKWTKSWLDKNCESKRWAWPQYQKQKINQPACDALEPWHHDKCAFCEAPLSGHREIEHFRSKTGHPLAAFVWRNLFLICSKCNGKKGDRDHAGSLKPDCHDPADYLWINPISLKMEPKPGISPEARQRAIKTINLYQLDRPELTKLYRLYCLQRVFLAGPLLHLARLVVQSPENDAEMIAQLPFERARLKALADPSQPFSLMVRSVLEY
jgi:uncharacterized protein (TIGR02646 family)